jgi:hypothetical protein
MTARIIANTPAVVAYAHRIELRAKLARHARLCNQIERAILADYSRRIEDGFSPSPLNRKRALNH